MSLTTITVTGAFTRPDGTPAQGSVTATLSAPLTNGTAEVEANPVVGSLNALGQLVASTGLPFTLVANDDPATVPVGSHYTFLLDLDSQPLREFEAVISHSAPGATVDLSTLAPPEL